MDYTGHVLVIVALLLWSAWYYGILPDRRKQK